MKPTTTAYALAASFLPFVLASPFHQQRHAAVEVVTAVDTVTAVDQVYVTEYADAGAAPAAPTSEAAPATTLVTVVASSTPEAAVSSAPSDDDSRGHGKNQHNWSKPNSWDGQNNWHKSSSSQEAAPVAPTPTPSSSPIAAPPPAPTTTSTSTPPPSPPPAPTTTSTSTPPPPPPAPTTTSVAPAPTTAKTTSAAATKATLAPYQTGDSSYTKDSIKANTLNSTNVWRSMFNAKPIAWNQTLADMAQNTADACSWDHTNAGQNYAEGYSGPAAATDDWGFEYTKYKFDNTFSHDCGHFTQLVWQDSTTVGCAAKKCPSDGSTSAYGWFFVCNYFPVGNMLGEFSEQVSQKTGLSPY